MRAPLSFLLLALGIFLPATAGAQETGAIRIEQPWARASIIASRPAAAYLTVINESEEPVRIIGFEAPVARQAEPHRMVAEDGRMTMRPAGVVEVASGRRLVLEPGGLHLMLMGLTEPLKEGETFPLTLRFEDGAPVTVTVPVLGIGAKGPKEG